MPSITLLCSEIGALSRARSQISNPARWTTGAMAWLLMSLAFPGCNDVPNGQPKNDSAPARGDAGTTEPANRPPQEEVASWLTTGLPRVSEELSSSSIKLSEPQLAANEFGQELLSVSYERPAVVRTLAAEASLVLLPANGGRFSVPVNPGILIQPQNSGVLRGITYNLLDYRGRLRSGARGYIEMRTATANMAAGKAARVSDVVWFGGERQLWEAVRRGPPPEVGAAADVPELVLRAVPTGPIPKGTPLWMRCGDRWSRGYALEDGSGDHLRLLIYLVRRDKPYVPWEVSQPRSELRIEKDALAELQHDPNSFGDLADANDVKLSRQGVPNKLEPVDVAKLKAGDAVLDFWNGMLDPCRVTGTVKENAVPLQRIGLDNAKMVKSPAGLFTDPFGKSEKP